MSSAGDTGRASSSRPRARALTNKHVIDEYEKFKNATDEGRVRRLLTALKEVYAVKRDQTGRPVADKEGRPEMDPDVIALIDQVETRTRTSNRSSWSTSARSTTRRTCSIRARGSTWRRSASTGRADRPLRPQRAEQGGQASRGRGPRISRRLPAGGDRRGAGGRGGQVKTGVARRTAVREGEPPGLRSRRAAFELTPTPGQISVVQQETGGIVQRPAHGAPIRPGNSGGPLVFREGEQAGVVYGINTLYLKGGFPGLRRLPGGADAGGAGDRSQDPRPAER